MRVTYRSKMQSLAQKEGAERVAGQVAAPLVSGGALRLRWKKLSYLCDKSPNNTHFFSSTSNKDPSSIRQVRNTSPEANKHSCQCWPASDVVTGADWQFSSYQHIAIMPVKV